MNNLSFKIENDQKQILLAKISEIIDKFAIKSILDIGAGHLFLATSLSRKVEKYTAIETEPNRVKQLQEAGLNAIKGTFPEVEISHTYDLVLSSHSIPEQIEKYQPFLSKAWQLVKPNGWLVVITFKGVRDSLDDITNQLRKSWIDADKQKYEEMTKVLSTFGKVVTEKIVSHSSSKDIDEMTNLLTLSVGGTDEEKKLYRQKFKKILEEKYKTDNRYIFPHEHLVLLVHKKG